VSLVGASSDLFIGGLFAATRDDLVEGHGIIRSYGC
jgi:hypothetical protein